jgi:uncharacterized protein
MIRALRSNSGSMARVGTFVGLLAALSAIFYFFIIYCGRTGGGRGIFVTGIMWCPALAALVTVSVYGGRFSDLGWRWGKTRYQLISYAIPLGYAALAYALAWSTGLARVGNPEALASIANDYGWTTWPKPLVLAGYVLLQATVGLVASCANALGEEIGWRGFLVPELSRRLSFTAVSFVSGVIWAAWHYPGLLFADYHSPAPLPYALACFTIMVVGMSFVFAWLRLRSGSLWTGMFLHASHNLFVQSVFDPLTSDTPLTKYITGEFGASLALVATGAAFIAWRRRKVLDEYKSEMPEA